MKLRIILFLGFWQEISNTFVGLVFFSVNTTYGRAKNIEKLSIHYHLSLNKYFWWCTIIKYSLKKRKKWFRLFSNIPQLNVMLVVSLFDYWWSSFFFRYWLLSNSTHKDSSQKQFNSPLIIQILKMKLYFVNYLCNINWLSQIR